MHLENRNVALLVHSCDRYEFLYKGFEFFFNKYWNFNAECNYYFATEIKHAVVNNFNNIQSGKGEWADRLTLLLKEKITEKYVLYFQEDMWINKATNPRFFNQLFELAEKNNWQQVKLHSSDVYKTIKTDLFIDGFNIALVDNARSDFLMSHQVTLWNKEFLLEQLHKKEHPWRNERRGTKRLKKLNPPIFHIDYFSENGAVENNENKNPVLRSEYQTISLNGILNDNITPYITGLMNEGSAYRDYGLKLQYNYTHKLTHDGLSKPRKVDVFKRIKNWVQGKE
ncbi:MAG: hypothetical protein KF862_11020 [Chitinophagaceae bacterium]|nr:hypothetical protein [Chitinophagaceae bacterium]